MATPRKKPAPAAGSRAPSAATAPSSALAVLTSPSGVLAMACAAAALVVYLFVFGPLSTRSLPASTRTPGLGSPLASAPHLVCGDAEAHTESVSQSAATLDELAHIGRERAGDVAQDATEYQISLDVPDEATATASLISWKQAGAPDPLIQLSATRAADGTGWQLAGITTCR